MFVSVLEKQRTTLKDCCHHTVAWQRCAFEQKWNRQLTRSNFPAGAKKRSRGTRLTSTTTSLYYVVEHNLYEQFIQPFSFLRKWV